MEKFEKFATAIFALLFVISVAGFCLYLYSLKRPEMKKPGTKIQQGPCPACGQSISPRARACPHCGDEPSQDAFLVYGLAGFTFLLGVQFLQITLLARKDRVYLYLLLMLAATCLAMSAITKEISNYSGLLLLLGGYLLFLAMVHLSYLVLWKKPAAASLNNKR